DGKMEDRLLNLKWSTRQTIFFENLKILREKSNYTDATLAVEDKFYPVHKLVMSTCSEYFNDIFEKTTCKSPVIVLKDVSSHDIEALLDYMYLGEVNVNQSDLASLLKTAKCLKIKGFAVSEEDVTKVIQNTTRSHDEYCWNSPSLKRRRHDSNSIPPNVLSPVPSPQMSSALLDNTGQTKSIPTYLILNTEQDEPQFVKVEIDDDDDEELCTLQDKSPGMGIAEDSNTNENETTDVKVEMDCEWEEEEIFRSENNHERGSSNDQDPLEGNGSDISKTLCEPEKHDNISLPGPKLQQIEHHSPCKKLLQHGHKAPNGCTLGRAKCDKFHPKMCHTSLTKRFCYNIDCQATHVTGTVRSPPENTKESKLREEKRRRVYSYYSSLLGVGKS
ncbi:unnamed protein product, partial [Meganyctiphanes norvegica]